MEQSNNKLARIYNQKLKSILSDIKKNAFFHRHEAYIHMFARVEIQKRGHAHYHIHATVVE